jgi:uncharacterized membrane protein
MKYGFHNTEARILGGIGAIFALLSFVPTVGGVLGVIGFVMILVAVKYIADGFYDQSIFNNMMIAVILAISGIIAGTVIILPTVLNAFQNGYFNGANFAPSISVTMAQWVSFGTTIGLGLLATWVFFLASAVFLRRSYKTIGTHLHVHMFETAGMLYLFGAATAIVGIGFAILFVAQILTAVAFLSIPEAAGIPAQPQSVPASH